MKFDEIVRPGSTESYLCRLRELESGSDKLNGYGCKFQILKIMIPRLAGANQLASLSVIRIHSEVKKIVEWMLRELRLREKIPNNSPKVPIHNLGSINKIKWVLWIRVLD